MENSVADKARTDYLDIAIQLSPLLHALGHRARVQILLHLAKYQGCSAGSISSRLPLAKSTVSGHLSKLKEAGLISSRDDGNSVRYSMNEQGYAILKKFVHEMFDTIEDWKNNQTECCDIHAGELVY